MTTKEKLLARVRNDFTYHRPPPDEQHRFTAIRAKSLELAELMIEHCPEGRELASALTRLEEATAHANAGIARQFPAEK